MTKQIKFEREQRDKEVEVFELTQLHTIWQDRVFIMLNDLEVTLEGKAKRVNAALRFFESRTNTN